MKQTKGQKGTTLGQKGHGFKGDHPNAEECLMAEATEQHTDVGFKAEENKSSAHVRP